MLKCPFAISKIYRRFEIKQTTKRVEALRGNFQIMAVIYHLFSKSTQRSLSKKCKTCRRASTNFECFSNFSHQRTEIYRGLKIKQTTKRVEALRGSFHIFAAILLLFSKSTRKASKKNFYLIFYRFMSENCRSF